MRLNDQERKILDDYLSTAKRPHKLWIIILFLGALFAVSAIVTLFFTHLFLAFSLLLLVTGLVTIAWGCEQRNKLIVAQILHEYHEALEEIERHSGRDINLRAAATEAETADDAKRNADNSP